MESSKSPAQASGFRGGRGGSRGGKTSGAGRKYTQSKDGKNDAKPSRFPVEADPWGINSSTQGLPPKALDQHQGGQASTEQRQAFGGKFEKENSNQRRAQTDSDRGRGRGRGGRGRGRGGGKIWKAEERKEEPTVLLETTLVKSTKGKTQLRVSHQSLGFNFDAHQRRSRPSESGAAQVVETAEDRQRRDREKVQRERRERYEALKAEDDARRQKVIEGGLEAQMSEIELLEMYSRRAQAKRGVVQWERNCTTLLEIGLHFGSKKD